MRIPKIFVLLFLYLGIALSSECQSSSRAIHTGADQTSKYFSLLFGKRVAIVANPTSEINGTSLVDSMLHSGIRVVKVFGPEHGFRGNASNGAIIQDSYDPVTGIPVVSLYGKKSTPSEEDLADVDIVVFDIQDVGARFFTYIITMQHVMQACADHGKLFMLLDRPNPNGFYVDGPVLADSLKSGVGLQPIPIVHGMTMGELAEMINGEGWLSGHKKCKIKIIRLANYTHAKHYTLPVAPSPNLNTAESILLYPSLCLFEGTVISIGRGTQRPFTVIGAPVLKRQYSFFFSPVGIPGMSEHPLYEDSTCYGMDLGGFNADSLRKRAQLNLRWLISMYKDYPHKEIFFDAKQSKQIGNFDKLAGTALLRKQIVSGASETDIRKSWAPALSAFKKKRKKYLLYPEK